MLPVFFTPEIVKCAIDASSDKIILNWECFVYGVFIPYRRSMRGMFLLETLACKEAAQALNVSVFADI